MLVTLVTAVPRAWRLWVQRRDTPCALTALGASRLYSAILGGWAQEASRRIPGGCVYFRFCGFLSPGQRRGCGWALSPKPASGQPRASCPWPGLGSGSAEPEQKSALLPALDGSLGLLLV